MDINLHTGKISFQRIAYSFPEFMIVLSVFTKELGTVTSFGVDFDFISYPFFVLFFVTKLTKILTYKRTPFILFGYLILSSLLSIFILRLGFDGFVKQIIPIIIIYSCCFFIIRKENILKLFHLYTKLAFFSAIFGIVQVLLSYVGIMILMKIPGRLDSIAYEPSHYASILLPALIFSFFNFKYYKREFLIMLTALIFTFNVTGYVVFLFILSIAYVNPIYLAIAIPTIYYVVFYFLPSIDNYFSMRFFDTMDVLSGKKNILNSSLDVNGTTLSFFSNWEVANHSIKENFLTGAGLGGHEEMYYRRFENTPFRYNYYYGLNAKSGHSLSIRILSELGVLGFVLYVIALVKNVLFLEDKIYKSIALACLAHFLCKTLKLGGYIDYGTPFFFAVLLLNNFFFRKRHAKL